MSHIPHRPIRTCVGCGARAPQRELLCLSSSPEGTLQVVDGRRRLGRTAYLHRRLECWERFAARKGPVRSLRRGVEKSARLAVVQRLKAVEPSAMMR